MRERNPYDLNDVALMRLRRKPRISIKREITNPYDTSRGMYRRPDERLKHPYDLSKGWYRKSQADLE